MDSLPARLVTQFKRDCDALSLGYMVGLAGTDVSATNLTFVGMDRITGVGRLFFTLAFPHFPHPRQAFPILPEELEDIIYTMTAVRLSVRLAVVFDEEYPFRPPSLELDHLEPSTPWISGVLDDVVSCYSATCRTEWSPLMRFDKYILHFIALLIRRVRFAGSSCSSSPLLPY